MIVVVFTAMFIRFSFLTFVVILNFLHSTLVEYAAY